MGVKISGINAVSKYLDKVSDLSKPLNSSANRAKNEMRTIASKAIREKSTLKKDYVDKELKARVKYARPNNQNIEITVTAQRRGTLMRNYVKSMPKGKGAKIEIIRGKPVHIKRAFKLRLKQGIETVVWRKDKNDRSRGFKDRLFVMHGPSPSQIMDKKQDDIRERGTERLNKTLEHNIERYLKNGK